MTVFDLRVGPSPEGFRASAKIESEGGPSGELWFEATGGACAPPPGMAAGAFLAACLPTAVWREEDLQIDAPVDAELLRRARRQARASAKLHLRGRIIQIDAPSVASAPSLNKLVGASFSGGVDSFHTLMSNLGPENPMRIGALVTGLGFDTRPDDLEAHAELLARLGSVSGELGLRHFAVRTNFRPFFREHADWNRVTHGGALVAFALLLSGELSTYLIPASYTIDESPRWGTHSLLDGGWECGHLRVVVDGWHLYRFEKGLEVADWPLAMRELRVCSRGRGTANCGRCEKCLRTMVLLELYGKDATLAFPHPPTPELVRSLRFREVRALSPWESMLRRARLDPRHAGLAAAIGHVVRMTRLHSPRRRLAARIGSGRNPLDPKDG